MEDTLDDGTGASADEGFEEEGQTEEAPDYSDNPYAYIESRDDIPEEVREAVKRGFLRQADYTRKTQVLAAERSRLEDRRSVVDQILLSQKEGKAPAAEEKDEGPPDMKNGASPEDVINYYVDQAVQSKIEALGIGKTVEEIRPIAAQQRVVRAYQSWASGHPDVDHTELASMVGQVLDSDTDLADIAEVDPDRAIRIAVKVARANTSAAKTKAKSKKRREAAPVASRKGPAVRQKDRETALEAATRALKEQGINI
jgi:hypothetical protein